MSATKRPKFIQIATTVIGGHEYLYALDCDGGVWWLDPVDDDQWTDLTKESRWVMATNVDSSPDLKEDAEAARWQNRIAETISSAGLKPFDASGCDSGDPLDWTDEQVRHALASQQEEIDALRAVVDVVKEEIVASGSGHVDCGDVACVLCRLRRIIVGLPRVG